jgi:hypothetical protein
VTSKRCRASKEGPLVGLGTGIKSFQPARKEGRATGKVGAERGVRGELSLLLIIALSPLRKLNQSEGEALPVRRAPPRCAHRG